MQKIEDIRSVRSKDIDYRESCNLIGRGHILAYYWKLGELN